MLAKLPSKKAVKHSLESRSLLSWLVPFAQWMLGLEIRLRQTFYKELLRGRLLALRLSAGKPLLVFCRFGAIGDVICTFPAAEALQQKYPHLHLVYVTLAPFGSLPRLAGIFPSVLTSRLHCPLPRLPLTVVGHSFEPGYTDELGQASSTRHLIDEFCAACSVAAPTAGPRFRLPGELLSAALSRHRLAKSSGETFVAIHTGPSWPVRQWPEERWRELVAQLRREFQVRIFHIGAARHLLMGERALAPIEGCESLVGTLPLDEMAAFLSAMDLFVGIDSGMLHMAGAAGAPCVGIFGPTDPEYRLPHGVPAEGVFQRVPCSFCHHRVPRLHWETGCPHEIVCLRDLPVSAVFAACARLLREKIAPGGPLTVQP